MHVTIQVPLDPLIQDVLEQKCNQNKGQKMCKYKFLGIAMEVGGSPEVYPRNKSKAVKSCHNSIFFFKYVTLYYVVPELKIQNLFQFV